MTLIDDYNSWTRLSELERKIENEPRATIGEWLDTGLLKKELYEVNRRVGLFGGSIKYRFTSIYAKLTQELFLEKQKLSFRGDQESRTYLDVQHNREVTFNSKEFIDLIEEDLRKAEEAKDKGEGYILTYAKNLRHIHTFQLSERETELFPSLSQIIEELNKENKKLEKENAVLRELFKPDPFTGKSTQEQFDLLKERDELRKEVNKLKIKTEKWQEINKLNSTLREENRVLREDTIQEVVSRGLKQAKDDIERAWKDKKDLIIEKVRLQVINGLIKRKVAGETLPIYDDNILKTLEERVGDVLDDKGKIKEFGSWTKLIEWQVNKELGEPFTKWDPYKVISTEERTLEEWRLGYNIGGKDAPFYMYPYRINADQYNNLVEKFKLIGIDKDRKFTYDRIIDIWRKDEVGIRLVLYCEKLRNKLSQSIVYGDEEIFTVRFEDEKVWEPFWNKVVEELKVFRPDKLEEYKSEVRKIKDWLEKIYQEKRLSLEIEKLFKGSAVRYDDVVKKLGEIS